MDGYYYPQTENRLHTTPSSMRLLSDGLSLAETKTNSFFLENKQEPSVSTPNTQSSHGSSTTTVKVPLPSGRRSRPGRTTTPTRRSRSPFFRGRRRDSSTEPRRKRNGFSLSVGPRRPPQQQRSSFWRRGGKQAQPPPPPKKKETLSVPSVEKKAVKVEPTRRSTDTKTTTTESMLWVTTSAPQTSDSPTTPPSIEVEVQQPPGFVLPHTPSFCVDYASRSDGSCVEVYFGGDGDDQDHKSVRVEDDDDDEERQKVAAAAVKVEPPAFRPPIAGGMEPELTKQQSRQGSSSSFSASQQQKNPRNNVAGSREQSHTTTTPVVDRPSIPLQDKTTTPLPPLEQGFSMMEQSLAKHAAAEQMRATAPSATSSPVVVIDARDVSDLVSELSDGPVAAAPRRSSSVRDAAPPPQGTLKKESVNRVRFALTKLQEEAEDGKQLSPKNIVQKILDVTDTLASKRDRELIRRQLSQLSSFSEESSQMLTTAPETSDHTRKGPSSSSRWMGEDDVYLPIGLCQFPGDRGLLDDLSETSSFVDWLQQQENKNQWNFADMLDVSSLWRNPEEKEWVDFTEDNKEHSSTAPRETTLSAPEESVRDEPENCELKTPPKIKRQLSSNRTFKPQSYSFLQYEQLQNAHKPSNSESVSKDKRSSFKGLPVRQRTSEELAMTKRHVYDQGRKAVRPQGREQAPRSSKQQPAMGQSDMLFVRRKASGNERTLVSVPSDEMSHERYRTYLGERFKQRSRSEAKTTTTAETTLARQALQKIKMRHQATHADYLRRRNSERAVPDTSHDENHRRKALDP